MKKTYRVAMLVCALALMTALSVSAFATSSQRPVERISKIYFVISY